MSSTLAQTPPKPIAERVFRLSVKQYHAMIEGGVLTENDPVELIDGVLVYQMPKKPKHGVVIRTLAKATEAMLPSGYFVQLQDPVTLRTSEPEPDIAVVRGKITDYAVDNPHAADVPLITEVAESSPRIDRGMKLRAYASAGIEVYCIVDLARQCIELCTEPIPKQRKYRQRIVLAGKDRLPIVLFGRKIGEVAVSAVFP